MEIISSELKKIFGLLVVMEDGCEKKKLASESLGGGGGRRGPPMQDTNVRRDDKRVQGARY